jgi:NADH-quinone oxidoreductase subunit F
VRKIKSLQDLEAFRNSIAEKRKLNKPCIAICSGAGCSALGCQGIIDATIKEIERQKLRAKVDIKTIGCPGFCEQGPLVVVYPQNILYTHVKVEDISEIISETMLNGKIIDRLLYIDPASRQEFIHEFEVPFYKKQKRLLLGNNSKIDPNNIEDYIVLGGYSALAEVLLDRSPEQVIEEVKRSGLRGRGGGGFPAGRKWQSCRDAPGEPKYVIANCDEGDPGAFANRSLLEGNPHSVLEGLIICAYAIGSHEGYIYVRNEYPLAVENATTAIKQAEKLGFLGKNILDSGFDFIVHINRGGGAFVCGESTALMASLEGRVGEPRAKYIHTVEKGLWDKPSNLNNVETLANVPLIINKGADWFKGIGTEGSKGTKIFSLVGKVNNTGLVEVPMGMTLREVIYDIGGGIKEGKRFKGVQTGGPSGGVIPERMLDMPVDFDELTEAGSMMGSGGMIVMDEDTCMVDTAKYFLTFLEEESCGKCVPCREGIKRMRQILDDITEGKGEEGDIELLERIAATLKDTSLCALGATAANPVLTTLHYFGDEYEAHIKDKRCPAGVCKALLQYYIIDEKCMGCRLCEKACPVEAITFMGKKKPVILDQSKCIKCGICKDVCNLEAVGVK